MISSISYQQGVEVVRWGVAGVVVPGWNEFHMAEVEAVVRLAVTVWKVVPAVDALFHAHVARASPHPVPHVSLGNPSQTWTSPYLPSGLPR